MNQLSMQKMFVELSTVMMDEQFSIQRGEDGEDESKAMGEKMKVSRNKLAVQLFNKHEAAGHGPQLEEYGDVDVLVVVLAHLQASIASVKCFTIWIQKKVLNQTFHGSILASLGAKGKTNDSHTLSCYFVLCSQLLDGLESYNIFEEERKHQLVDFFERRLLYWKMQMGTRCM